MSLSWTFHPNHILTFAGFYLGFIWSRFQKVPSRENFGNMTAVCCVVWPGGGGGQELPARILGGCQALWLPASVERRALLSEHSHPVDEAQAQSLAAPRTRKAAYDFNYTLNIIHIFIEPAAAFRNF
ncbi:hypothetical protein B0H14DRAFT_2639606 [Mycena olivaceomarginata]|nr:hypothetical protein B0H14DRAFT_2639606 [Mycena olivaceomarginata]